MAQDEGTESTSGPMPEFHFEVYLGTGMNFAKFQEITGTDLENQIRDYRNGNDPLLSRTETSGVAEYGKITMKRGLFSDFSIYSTWYAEATMNIITPRTILIRLLDKSGKAVLQWTLINAWPIKITVADLNSDGNEIEVDTLEVSYEEMMIRILK